MSDNSIANLLVLSALLPATSTSTRTGTGIDVTAYDGNVACIVRSSVGTGTTPTLDFKLQDSDAVGGTYADVTGATATQITDAAEGALNTQKIVFNANKVKAFVRVVGTIAGTTPSFINSAEFVGNKQYN